MSARIWLSSAALSTFAIFAVVSAAPSAALTAKECSVKYKAAKAAGTLNGETWNDFRKKECAGTEVNNQIQARTKASSSCKHSGSVRCSVSQERRCKVCQEVRRQGSILYVS